jgi:hypothetical protein
MLRRPIAIVLSATLAVSGAHAALLTNIQGTVTVNHGYGYESAGVGGQVGPGDRVRVGEGSADIVYENGSTVSVRSGQTVIVQSTAPASAVGSQTQDTQTYVVGGMLVSGGVAAAIVISERNSGVAGGNSQGSGSGSGSGRGASP